jgi:hypothetical protein
MRTNEIAHITALERQAHAAARRAGKVLRKCGDDRFLIVCPRLNRVTPRHGTGQTKCPATGETTMVERETLKRQRRSVGWPALPIDARG